MKHKAQIRDLVLVSILRNCPSCCISLLTDTSCPRWQSPVHSFSLGDKHGALLRARSGMGNQALFLLVNHQENCNYFPATQFDPAFN